MDWPHAGASQPSPLLLMVQRRIVGAAWRCFCRSLFPPGSRIVQSISQSPARALAARLALTSVGVIAWSRTGDPNLSDWGPPEVLVRTGVIPDEYEQQAFNLTRSVLAEYELRT